MVGFAPNATTGAEGRPEAFQSETYEDRQEFIAIWRKPYGVSNFLPCTSVMELNTTFQFASQKSAFAVP